MSQSRKNAEDAVVVARSGKTKWVVLGLILVMAVIAVMILPRGYSDDLTRTGKGVPSIVLIRDKNAVQSFDLLTVMDSLRDQYAGKVEFLLTDYGTTETTMFMEAHHAPKVTLVMLDANGKLVKVLYPTQTVASVEQEIADGFGVKP